MFRGMRTTAPDSCSHCQQVWGVTCSCFPSQAGEMQGLAGTG